MNATSVLNGMRVGYAPNSAGLDAPGDRRRFCRWAAQRGVDFEVSRHGERYDLVVLSERADITHWARHPRDGTLIVYDLIDSYFEEPWFRARPLLRGTAKRLVGETSHWVPSYRRAMAALCARADAVVCSTDEQRTSIARFATNVHPILDIHSTAVRHVKEDYRTRAEFHLVWEGIPQTVHGLLSIENALASLAQTRPTVLNIVTDPRYGRLMGRYWNADTRRLLRSLPLEVRLHRWTEETLALVATGSDLAIIPIDLSDPLAVAKPENKLLLFWRRGLPTLTSTTPAYGRTMRNAGADATCGSEGEWLAALTNFAENEALRRASAQNGRDYAEGAQGEEVMLTRWDVMFQSLVEMFPPK